MCCPLGGKCAQDREDARAHARAVLQCTVDGLLVSERAGQRGLCDEAACDEVVAERCELREHVVLADGADRVHAERRRERCRIGLRREVLDAVDGVVEGGERAARSRERDLGALLDLVEAEVEGDGGCRGNDSGCCRNRGLHAELLHPQLALDLVGRRDVRSLAQPCQFLDVTAACREGDAGCERECVVDRQRHATRKHCCDVEGERAQNRQARERHLARRNSLARHLLGDARRDIRDSVHVHARQRRQHGGLVRRTRRHRPLEVVVLQRVVGDNRLQCLELGGVPQAPSARLEAGDDEHVLGHHARRQRSAQLRLVERPAPERVAVVVRTALRDVHHVDGAHVQLDICAHEVRQDELLDGRARCARDLALLHRDLQRVEHGLARLGRDGEGVQAEHQERIDRRVDVVLGPGDALDGRLLPLGPNRQREHVVPVARSSDAEGACRDAEGGLDVRAEGRVRCDELVERVRGQLVENLRLLDLVPRVVCGQQSVVRLVRQTPVLLEDSQDCIRHAVNDALVLLARLVDDHLLTGPTTSGPGTAAPASTCSGPCRLCRANMTPSAISVRCLRGAPPRRALDAHASPAPCCTMSRTARRGNVPKMALITKPTRSRRLPIATQGVLLASVGVSGVHLALRLHLEWLNM